ncbi:MAG: hypothetical protein AB7S77_02050 [Desulfatirhabdiaceae bacterium]
MISEDSFFQLFCKEVQTLSAEKGLVESESALIIETVRQALANQFLDERHIVARLSGQGTADEH